MSVDQLRNRQGRYALAAGQSLDDRVSVDQLRNRQGRTPASNRSRRPASVRRSASQQAGPRVVAGVLGNTAACPSISFATGRAAIVGWSDRRDGRSVRRSASQQAGPPRRPDRVFRQQHRVSVDQLRNRQGRLKPGMDNALEKGCPSISFATGRAARLYVVRMFGIKGVRRSASQQAGPLFLGGLW